jgi:hypothetical protein
MAKSLFPIRVGVKDPAALVAAVQDEIMKGNDLHAPLFVALTGELCQYMVPGKCLYTYHLIDAVDLADLDTQVQNMAALGFDFIFNTVMWNGHYLQWMCRMNSMGQSLTEALKAVSIQSSAAGEGALAMNDRELQFVESVTPVWRGKFLVGGQ